MKHPPNNLLAPGVRPIVARLHEVEAEHAPAHLPPPLPSLPFLPSLPSPPRPAQPPKAPLQAKRPPAAQPEAAIGDGAMPFIGTILDYVAGKNITVQRRLTLDQDLHLADHHFVPAADAKPLETCFPVLPMTFSLEAMAEVAACLAPGLGLSGMDDVTAARWIALTDSPELLLRIEASVAPPRRQLPGQAAAPEHGIRIAVAIFVEGQPQAAIKGYASFAQHYARTLHFNFPPLVPERTRHAATIYAERRLFHGPRLHCLDGSIELSLEGAAASLVVRAPDELFRTTRHPLLLTDPALMDGVGQLMGIWAFQHQRVSFPIGIGALEFYGPTPPPGTRAPIRVHFKSNNMKMTSADVEIGNGAGQLWLRIRDWKSWLFHWDQRVIDFRRDPGAYLLSDRVMLPAQLGDAFCLRVNANRLAGFDRDLLARHYLHPDEMAAYVAHAGNASRQLEWLLGRIAAKDALRSWALQHGSTGAKPGSMAHPASLAIANDAHGKPHVSNWPGAAAIPALSIAHCADQAVALVHREAAGVDIERISERDAGFIAAFTTPAERSLLEDCPPAERQQWLTRLWCAKEVFGKLMGTGVRPGPAAFEAQTLQPGGTLGMLHRPSGTAAMVHTISTLPFMIALGIASSPSSA
jgi:4'-phosphopantetheinyl transferase EntD